jgi:hypothetical protein
LTGYAAVRAASPPVMTSSYASSAKGVGVELTSGIGV